VLELAHKQPLREFLGDECDRVGPIYKPDALCFRSFLEYDINLFYTYNKLNEVYICSYVLYV